LTGMISISDVPLCIRYPEYLRVFPVVRAVITNDRRMNVLSLLPSGTSCHHVLRGGVMMTFRKLMPGMLSSRSMNTSSCPGISHQRSNRQHHQFWRYATEISSSVRYSSGCCMSEQRLRCLSATNKLIILR